MPSLIDTISSPAWWITAVLVGILINLLSAYLKRPLDRLGVRVSRSFATASRERQQLFEEAVSASAGNQSVLLSNFFAELRCLLKGTVYLLMAVAFFVGGTHFRATSRNVAASLFLLAGTLLVLGARYFLAAGSIAAITARAVERLSGTASTATPQRPAKNSSKRT